MENKTAMMELIEHIKTIWSNQGWEDTVIEKATQLLEKEKEQMVEFADKYGFNVCGYDYDRAEQYYNETYKQD